MRRAARTIACWSWRIVVPPFSASWLLPTASKVDRSDFGGMLAQIGDTGCDIPDVNPIREQLVQGHSLG